MSQTIKSNNKLNNFFLECQRNAGRENLEESLVPNILLVSKNGSLFCHAAILMAWSPLVKDHLFHPDTDNEGLRTSLSAGIEKEPIVIHLLDYDMDVVEGVVQLLYTGICCIPRNKLDLALELLKVLQINDNEITFTTAKNEDKEEAKSRLQTNYFHENRQQNNNVTDQLALPPPPPPSFNNNNSSNVLKSPVFKSPPFHVKVQSPPISQTGPSSSSSSSSSSSITAPNHKAGHIPQPYRPLRVIRSGVGIKVLECSSSSTMTQQQHQNGIETGDEMSSMNSERKRKASPIKTPNTTTTSIGLSPKSKKVAESAPQSSSSSSSKERPLAVFQQQGPSGMMNKNNDKADSQIRHQEKVNGLADSSSSSSHHHQQANNDDNAGNNFDATVLVNIRPPATPSPDLVSQNPVIEISTPVTKSTRGRGRGRGRGKRGAKKPF